MGAFLSPPVPPVLLVVDLSPPGARCGISDGGRGPRSGLAAHPRASDDRPVRACGSGSRSPSVVATVSLGDGFFAFEETGSPWY